MSSCEERLKRLRDTPGLPAWIIRDEKSWRRSALIALLGVDDCFLDRPTATEIAEQAIARASVLAQIGQQPLGRGHQ